MLNNITNLKSSQSHVRSRRGVVGCHLLNKRDKVSFEGAELKQPR